MDSFPIATRIFITLATFAIVGRAITIESNKEIIAKMKQSQLKAITAQEATDKSPILLSQY